MIVALQWLKKPLKIEFHVGVEAIIASIFHVRACSTSFHHSFINLGENRSLCLKSTFKALNNTEVKEKNTSDICRDGFLRKFIECCRKLPAGSWKSTVCFTCAFCWLKTCHQPLSLSTLCAIQSIHACSDDNGDRIKTGNGILDRNQQFTMVDLGQRHIQQTWQIVSYVLRVIFEARSGQREV